MVSLIYPARCLACGGVVETDFGLCGGCWGKTHFIGGAICDTCSVPLLGPAQDAPLTCDACMRWPRPWKKARAALVYDDTARRLVLGLKHGDRQEIAGPAARWMARAIADLPKQDLLLAPVPLHWTRLLKRRYNQAALLAAHLAAQEGLAICPDLLIRHRRTVPMERLGAKQRFENQKSAIKVHPRRQHHLIGRPILLVDDVFTSGATLSAAAHACLAAGSGPIYVVALARVAKAA